MKPRDRDSGQSERQAVDRSVVGAIPRGIEVLVKKASVDPEFRELLLEKRAEAAKEIELELTAAEAAMLASIPQIQLEAIIANTRVRPENKGAFLGKVGKVMLAALGVGVAMSMLCPTLGHQSDRVREIMSRQQEEANQPRSGPEPPRSIGVAGIMPDDRVDANKISRGISPRRPPVTEDIEPDSPE